jgi:competence ComEA-like helix-hairpin-helix protein
MRSDSPAEHTASVDLNAADKDQLRASLPGIGAVLADRIIAFREDHGPFSSITDLERVPGIGPRLAGRLSERVRVSESIVVPRVAISPLSPLSFDPGASLRPPESTRHSGSPVSHDDGLGAVVMASAPPPHITPRYPRMALVAVGFMALVMGATAGSFLSDRKAGAATASVDQAVQVLRVEGGRTREDVSRQGAALVATQETLSAVIESQKAAEQRVTSQAARVSKDVADLADRTRQAQARTDSRVVQLDEAMKLIDWVATKGYAHQVVSQGSPSAPIGQ